MRTGAGASSASERVDARPPVRRRARALRCMCDKPLRRQHRGVRRDRSAGRDLHRVLRDPIPPTGKRPAIACFAPAAHSSSTASIDCARAFRCGATRTYEADPQRKSQLILAGSLQLGAHEQNHLQDAIAGSIDMGMNQSIERLSRHLGSSRGIAELAERLAGVLDPLGEAVADLWGDMMTELLGTIQTPDGTLQLTDDVPLLPDLPFLPSDLDPVVVDDLAGVARGVRSQPRRRRRQRGQQLGRSRRAHELHRELVLLASPPHGVVRSAVRDRRARRDRSRPNTHAWPTPRWASTPTFTGRRRPSVSRNSPEASWKACAPRATVRLTMRWRSSSTRPTSSTPSSSGAWPAPARSRTPKTRISPA